MSTVTCGVDGDGAASIHSKKPMGLNEQRSRSMFALGFTVAKMKGGICKGVVLFLNGFVLGDGCPNPEIALGF